MKNQVLKIVIEDNYNMLKGFKVKIQLQIKLNLASEKKSLLNKGKWYITPMNSKLNQL